MFGKMGKPHDVQNVGLDWIEQGLTSPPTQYRLSGRQFYKMLAVAPV